MRRNVISFVSGLVFAVGLAIAGMTQPAKVVAFLDVAGGWDPSLAFVMVGAIAVYALAYRSRLRMESPVFAREFPRLDKTRIDARLLAGAAVFGVGWGLAGFCPGPGIASLGAGGGHVVVFVTTMLAGMFLVRVVDRVRSRPASLHTQPRSLS